MSWIACHLITGKLQLLERFPFIVGSSPDVDFHCPGEGVPDQAIWIQSKGKGIQVDIHPGQGLPARCFLNGQTLRPGTVLTPDTENLLQLGHNPVFLFHSKEAEAWIHQTPPFQLSLVSSQGTQAGPWSPEDLSRQLNDLGPEWAQATVQLEGTQIRVPLEEWRIGAELFQEDSNWSGPDQNSSSPEGEFTCPFCLEKFDATQAKAIAVHEDLRGDRLLGPDAMLRFPPTNFVLGQPKDASGNPCPEKACPHCHQKLLPNFFEISSKIISLVGSARSGKSYLLAVLALYLPDFLAAGLKIRWEDHDPEGNILLNDLKNRLLAANDPEGAAIAKTAVGGVTYMNVHLRGRTVSMPRPFSYQIGKESRERLVSIFYDNAGEHFTPQISTDQNPGALHVSKAAGIMFLYDPLGNPSIKSRLRALGVEDPQIESDFADYQAIILAEMKTRIAKMRNLGPDAQLDVPLAFLVGKYDAWADIFESPSSKPRQVVHEGKLDLKAIEDNSWLARTFLNEFCPAVVQNAEALAPNIMYFPISAFGHSPVPTAKGFAPDPKRIRPMLVEAPVLWLMRHIRPDLVPVLE